MSNRKAVFTLLIILFVVLAAIAQTTTSNTTHWPMFRVPEAQWAFGSSPVAANGKIYFSGEYGEIFVVQAGAAFKLLAP